MHFPGIEPQQALPMVIQRLHNPVISGVIIAALLSAVMSSADSALNSATAIFVKDLFEHQLKWHHKSDKEILKLARYCTIILGLTATLIAVLWSDIIELLLFTYHVWAPAIILPVVIGVLNKKKSDTLNQNIFITIVSTTAITLIYRVTKYSENFDPAVFGVLLSFVIFYLLTTYSKIFKNN
jgi:SSS family solute:Na+ symporter